MSCFVGMTIKHKLCTACYAYGIYISRDIFYNESMHAEHVYPIYESALEKSHTETRDIFIFQGMAKVGMQ